MTAAVIFRRNIAAELPLFVDLIPPETVVDWFSLLVSNRMLALAYLNIFDVVNYGLVALMLLALYILLRRYNQSLMAIALVSGLLGIAVHFSSNTALSMLTLSNNYSQAVDAEAKASLEAAGEALLAFSRFTSTGGQPGGAGFISLLLVAAAGFLVSLMMLQSSEFNRWTANFGLLANGFDLAYCLGFIFVPKVDAYTLGILFLPAAGLFFLLWHLMVGWKLLKISR